MTQVATFIFVAGIAGLFVLNHERTPRTSKALWLPTLWLMIAGSRAVSAWLQMGPVSSPEQYIDGSPLDRNIYIGLLAVGVIVLLRRRGAVLRFLQANKPIFLFVLYCAASIGWSDHPEVAFKRWIKCLGDFVMILIVLTDPEPAAAVKRLLSRLSFVLLPASVLLIKYYPDLGRSYALHWEGTQFFTGVALDKNTFGMVCLVLGLATAWRFLQELGNPRGTRKYGVLVAHGAVLAMDFWLLSIVNSMTSLSCFLLAGGIMGATIFAKSARRPNAVHLMVAAGVALSFSVLFLNLGELFLSSVGRDPTLTGRTELWHQLLGMKINPIVGTGFESFWLGTRLETLWNIYWWHPNEAHNGYLEVFLNLGWMGLVLMSAVIITGYRNVIRTLGLDAESGRLRLAYFVVGVTYNFTEAAIRTMSLVWILFMLSIIALPTIAKTQGRVLTPPAADPLADGLPAEAAISETPYEEVFQQLL
jgi:O-antigen ligase